MLEIEVMDMTPEQERKQKLDVFLRLIALDCQDVRVYVDSRMDTVVLPREHRNKAFLALDFGLAMAKPIRDLSADVLGIEATLSFPTGNFRVYIPWRAVVGMRGASAGEAMWMSEVALADAMREVAGLREPEYEPRPIPSAIEGIRDSFAAARGETPRVSVGYNTRTTEDKARQFGARPSSSPRIRAQGRRTSKAPFLRIFDGGRGNDKGDA